METSHAVGLVVREHPAAAARMRVWTTAPNVWGRRSAIVCQLQHKADTDLDLLTAVGATCELPPQPPVIRSHRYGTAHV